MSLLKNPWVVAGMATVGLSVVGFNLYQQFRPKRFAPKPPTVAAAATSAPAPAAPGVTAAAAPSDTPPAASDTQIDRAHFTARMADWTQAAPHDPFSPPANPAPELPKGPAAAEVLKLQGTWRQTGGGVAVINRQTVSENEVVDGFTVLRIEADRVLVASVRGTEEITFPGGPGTAASAALPAAAQQARLTPNP